MCLAPHSNQLLICQLLLYLTVEDSSVPSCVLLQCICITDCSSTLSICMWVAEYIPMFVISLNRAVEYSIPYDFLSLWQLLWRYSLANFREWCCRTANMMLAAHPDLPCQVQGVSVVCMGAVPFGSWRNQMPSLRPGLCLWVQKISHMLVLSWKLRPLCAYGLKKVGLSTGWCWTTWPGDKLRVVTWKTIMIARLSKFIFYSVACCQQWADTSIALT